VRRRGYSQFIGLRAAFSMPLHRLLRIIAVL
jgi:hypothetical protein